MYFEKDIYPKFAVLVMRFRILQGIFQSKKWSRSVNGNTIFVGYGRREEHTNQNFIFRIRFAYANSVGSLRILLDQT